MPTEYVFIVGASRSGTTLMRRILNSSGEIAIADENHFLGHVIPLEGARYRFRKFGDLSDDNHVYRLVDHLYSGGFRKESTYRPVSFHWRWIVKNIDKQDFTQRILDSDRSERALFTIMMRVYADHLGKPIMGEKTPAHMRYVPTLLEWFPDAKIIHMLRSPQAVYVSELRRRKEQPITPPFSWLKGFDFLFKLYVVIYTTIIWLESVLRYFRYKRLYPNNYLLLKFEDLVSQPEKHIRRVCDFLEVKFQPAMLDQKVVSDGFQEGQAGFDGQAAVRWKKHIDPWINSWFSFCFRKYLDDFGYAH